MPCAKTTKIAIMIKKKIRTLFIANKISLGKLVLQ
jgi:hypothetical protein